MLNVSIFYGPGLKGGRYGQAGEEGRTSYYQGEEG